MPGELLHVLLAAPDSVARAQQALRAMRRAQGKEKEHTLLLFCDLPPADTARTPQDEPLLRHLQSGVMAMEARMPGRFLLLVRRRAWDDAARAYLGQAQATPPQRILAELLETGTTQAVFEAASFSPSSLKDRFDAILFTRDTDACTPDMPERMLHALEACGGCVRSRVIPRRLDGEPLLSRLMAQHFSLCAPETAYRAFLEKRGWAPEGDGPTLYARAALAAYLGGVPAPMQPCPLSEEALFVSQQAPTVADLIGHTRVRFARAYAHRKSDEDPSRLVQAGGLLAQPVPTALWGRLPLFCAVLPLVQMALLLLCAVLGASPWAFAAVVLPELFSVLMPRLLPGALVRTAFLPLTAALSLDALLAQLLARSGWLRLRLRGRALQPSGCFLCGVVLIPAAFLSVHAVVPLLAVGLLWLSAPLLARALSSPVRERIPLAPEELEQMATLAEHAFWAAEQTPYPARRMLTACAGRMLGVLETDEAARRVASALLQAQGLIDAIRADEPEGAPAVEASELACALASAQFLRENMGDCDAALRTLPTEIEALYLSLHVREDGGLLCALLQAAVSRQTPLSVMQRGEGGMALDALFLPYRLMSSLPPEEALQPLTHPHAFLRAQLPSPHAKKEETAASLISPDEAQRFLILCAPALDQPFEKLLWRSPAAEPYAPLLSVL